MDVVITNTTAEAMFFPGPNLEIAAGGTATWSDITSADLDGNTWLKQKVVDGDLTLAVTDDTFDAAPGIAPTGLPQYTVATLPTGFEGRVAFATDGRKTAEGAAAGTGVPVYYSAGDWHVYYDDSVV